MAETDTPLRLAVVGTGWAGTRQATAATEVPDRIEIVGLMDNDPEHLRATAAELGIGRIYGTLEEVLADPEVEAVSICTPHALHAQQAIAAAGAGKHVLVEKPMAMTVAEAGQMLDAAGVAGVELYVAESDVYQAWIGRLREIVQTGEHLGELAFATVLSGYRAADPRYPGRREWLTLPELGGTGTWMLQGIHAVAQLRHILGEVRTVFMREHRTGSFARPDLEATMAGTLVLDSGVVVQFIQTTEVDLRPRLVGFRLYGDRGTVVGHHEGYEVYRRDLRDDGRPVAFAWPTQERSPYALELVAFADQVRRRAEGPTTGLAERRSLAILEAGTESARTGQPVDLLERFPELAD